MDLRDAYVRAVEPATTTLNWAIDKSHYVLGAMWIYFAVAQFVLLYRAKGVPVATYDDKVLQVFKPKVFTKPQAVAIPVSRIKRYQQDGAGIVCVYFGGPTGDLMERLSGEPTDITAFVEFLSTRPTVTPVPESAPELKP